MKMIVQWNEGMREGRKGKGKGGAGIDSNLATSFSWKECKERQQETEEREEREQREEREAQKGQTYRRNP